MRRTDIPQFGPLQGVKVVHSSISIAGPFCAQLMADHGRRRHLDREPESARHRARRRLPSGLVGRAQPPQYALYGARYPLGKGPRSFSEDARRHGYLYRGLERRPIRSLGPVRRGAVASESGSRHRAHLRLWPGGRRLLRVPGVLRSYRPGVRRVDVRQFPSWYGAIPFLPRCGRRLLGLFGSGWRAGPPCTACAKQGGGKASISPSTRPFSAVRART